MEFDVLVPDLHLLQNACIITCSHTDRFTTSKKNRVQHTKTSKPIKTPNPLRNGCFHLIYKEKINNSIVMATTELCPHKKYRCYFLL